MTRKDYVKLAAAFQRVRPPKGYPYSIQILAWEQARASIMQTLDEDNPRFNRERFIKATEA